MTTARRFLRDAGPGTVLGVAGHRWVVPGDYLATVIRSALDHVTAMSPGPLTVLSQLAEGADRIIAHAGLERPDARLIAVLPRPILDYLSDFPSRSSVDEFTLLLNRAWQVIELPDLGDPVRQYAAAAALVVESSDAMLVVWDGHPPQGAGGTGESVEHARRLARPLAWVRVSGIEGCDQTRTVATGDGSSVTFERFPST